MKDGVKVIQTRYKGYRFRSRLEARWAVFFDSLGLDWAYEPEGYQLPGGQLYLPDFYIRGGSGLFVEIKGDYPTREERAKCAALRDTESKPVYLVSGLPLERAGELFCWDITDSSAGPSAFMSSIIWPASCAIEVICFEDDRVDRDRELCFSPNFSDSVEARHLSITEFRHPQKWAADDARAARFEHGETP